MVSLKSLLLTAVGGSLIYLILSSPNFEFEVPQSYVDEFNSFSLSDTLKISLGDSTKYTQNLDERAKYLSNEDIFYAGTN